MSAYRVCFISLGCAKNLVNTEQMMAQAGMAGHQLVEEPGQSQVTVVNTCGFIDSAKQEAIDQILELNRGRALGGPEKILVTGCLPQRHAEELLSELPEVDGILGCGSFDQIVPALDAVMDGRRPALLGPVDQGGLEGPRLVTTPGWTAYLKIAEGCDNHCAYCVIPSLRGRYRSRKMADVLDEARALAAAGVKELIVVAQDITRYGLDLGEGRQLARLLTALCQVEGIAWIRLHYLYPDLIDDALIDVIAGEEKILPYLDIPIQHCDDAILAAMGRRGTRAQLTALFETLRARIPNLVLRTSLICGLPGEGEAQFEALCGFLEEIRFERAGIFPFSPQEGTAAAGMPRQVDPETAQHRAALLFDRQARITDRWSEAQRGSVIAVLCEGTDPETGFFVGRSWADSPEVDPQVRFEAAHGPAPGDFVTVRVTGARDGDLIGRAEPLP